jgi:ABC-2 type transport system permease protein
LALPLLFSSTALIPQTLMYGWLATVAAWNPYTYIVAGTRALMTQSSIDLTALGAAVTVALGLLMVTQLLVLGAFREAVRNI